MVGVNLWSIFLILISIMENGTLFRSIKFIGHHPEFAWDVFLSSNVSAFGQLFIFLTIGHFGPVTFVLIMTIRLGLSILLSCFLFGHHLSILSYLGILLVFMALCIRHFVRILKLKRSNKFEV